MKKKLIILVALILLFVGFIFVRFFWLDKQNTYGRIRILSSPSAGVFIDNVALGKTPYEEKHKAGEFVLKLIPEGEASSTATWQGKVKINKNALTYVSRELGTSDLTSAGEIFTIVPMEDKPKSGNMGEIYIETEPAGSIVYLDNDEKGVSPILLQEVPKGDHELSVYSPGFFRRTQKINVEAGHRVTATFKLALDESQKTVEQAINEKKKQEASDEAKKKDEKTETEGTTMIVIGETPTGWLRVREEASLNGTEITRVNTGEKYELVEEDTGWYKIKLKDGTEGWVSAEYASKE